MGQVKFIKNNILFSLFLFSLFILKLYSFYVIPVPNVFFASHSFAKIILFSVSGIFLLGNFNKISDIIKQNKILFTLLLLYFIGQSLSIIPTIDIILFFRFYHNVILYIIIFCLTHFMVLKNKKRLEIITKFILFTGTIIVFYDLLLLVFFQYLKPIFMAVVQKEIVDAYLYNLSNGKYAIVFGNEIFLPIFLFIILSKGEKMTKKLFFLFLSVTVVFLSIFSNFRSRIIELLFALMTTIPMLVFSKKTLLSSFTRFRFFGIVMLLAVFVSTFYIAIDTSNYVNSFNIIDRLLLQDKYADLGPIDSRIEQVRLSFDEFVSSPLFGVGLGNYSIFTNIAPTRFSLENKQSYTKDVILASAARPHNIFFQLLGETGSVGLLTFLALLIYFAYRDLKYFNHDKKKMVWAHIVSSWTLIVYALFNPADTVYVMGWFWFFRGIISALRA